MFQDFLKQPFFEWGTTEDFFSTNPFRQISLKINMYDSKGWEM